MLNKKVCLHFESEHLSSSFYFPLYLPTLSELSPLIPKKTNGEPFHFDMTDEQWIQSTEKMDCGWLFIKNNSNNGLNIDSFIS